jgi:hypothetical protein
MGHFLHLVGCSAALNFSKPHNLHSGKFFEDFVKSSIAQESINARPANKTKKLPGMVGIGVG